MTVRGQDSRRLSVEHSETASASELERISAFPDIRCRRQGSSVEVSWRFVGDVTPPKYSGVWTWGLERSGSPGGPFHNLVAGLPSTTSFYRDDTVPRRREGTSRVYYRLFIQRGEETDIYGYVPEWDATVAGTERHGFTWEGAGKRTAHAPGVVRELRQRFRVLIDRYAGTPVLVYRAAWMEGACSVCTNPLTGRVSAGPSGTYCHACLGTGFVGGYYSPMRGAYVPSEAVQMPASVPGGTHDLREHQRVLMPHWPPVEPEDILRTVSGELYTVTEVMEEEMYHHAAVLVVSLSQLPRTSPLQSVPPPEDWESVPFGPRRQHGRAMNRQSYADSLAEGSMSRAQFELLSSMRKDDSPSR